MEEYSVQRTENREQSTENREQSTEYREQCTEYREQSTEYRVKIIISWGTPSATCYILQKIALQLCYNPRYRQKRLGCNDIFYYFCPRNR